MKISKKKEISILTLLSVSIVVSALCAFFSVQNQDFIRGKLFSVARLQASTLATLPEEKHEGPLWLPILVYHHIGTPPKGATSATRSFFIEPAWLERHLNYLKEQGFETVSYSDVADFFASGKPLPPRPVMINFDDAYKSTHERALPILEKFGMTATVFVPAHLVSHRAYMDWPQLEELRDRGWEIGSHTLWHPYLTKSKKAKLEITESKRILEEKLGRPVTAFAYPFGDYNTRIEAIVREAGYSTARSFSTGSGITTDNLFHIPVVRVWGNLPIETWKKQLFPPAPPG